MISFTIPGRPQPQERPFVLKAGWTMDRPASKRAKNMVYTLGLNARQIARASVSDANFAVRMVFYNAHKSADIDNLSKLVLDGLKGVFWKDDKQVYRLTVDKVHDSDFGRTYVEIQEL